MFRIKFSCAMPDFTTALPETHFRVPQRFVKSLIETHRQEQFTGLMRLRYPSGMDLVSTFVDGAQQELYGCLNHKMEVIPRQSWSYSMDRPDASISCLKLPVEAMRLARVAHEASFQLMEQWSCAPGELAENVERLTGGALPAVLHIHNEAFHRVYLIAGATAPIIEQLVIAGTEASFSLADARFPASLPEQEYHVLEFLSDPEHDVWQDYRLRYAFNPFLRMVLNRFSQLAGLVLTERLCEQLTFWLQEGGWQIGITINGVSNRHYFKSFAEAKRLYLDLIRRFNHESGLAIGTRMAEGIWRETLLKMDPQNRELLKRHLLDQAESWRNEL